MSTSSQCSVDVEEWMRSFEEILSSVAEQFNSETIRTGNHGHITEETARTLYSRISNGVKNEKLNSVDMLCELVELIQFCEAGSMSARHLATFLKKDNIKSLLYAAFDANSTRYSPTLPEIPYEVDENDGLAVKIVKLVKGEEPLGATIKRNENGLITIARVIAGGVADRSGCIFEGDRVLEVNGENVIGMDPKEISKILENSDGNYVTFKLMPSENRQTLDCDSCSSIYLRATFDYDGKVDVQNPCPEAALNFNKGDILELLVCSDKLWWQARCLGYGGLAHGEDDMRPNVSSNSKASNATKVGLIPSEALISTRTLSRKSSRNGTLSSSKRTETEEFHYEPVCRLYPSDNVTRPIVLIGPSGVGRNELRRRLTLAFPDKFSIAVPHTSRPPRPNEQNGVDYFFVPKVELEGMIHRGEMLEFGEFRGNYYGTSIAAVRRAIVAGTPLLTPHPLALKILRSKEFKPIIIFIQAPDKDVFLETRAALRARWSRATSQTSGSVATAAGPRGFTDSEVEKIILASDHLDKQLSHIFDARIINSHLETAFAALTRLIHKFETRPSWVPLNWASKD